MSYGERRMNVILEELRRNQRVQVADLSEMLGVSQESIRRDLKEMEARGHLRRVYGGAVADEKEADRPYSDRLRLAMREKIRIGQAAASLIENGMKVFIDTGTTAVACLRHLGDCRNVTVVSNSVAIAAYLCERPEIGFRMLGGRLRPEYQAVYGHETMTALCEHYFDLALLGISTVHLDRGFMDFGEDEAELRRIARDRVPSLRGAGRQFEIRPPRLDPHLRPRSSRRHHYLRRRSRGFHRKIAATQRGPHSCLIRRLPPPRPSMPTGLRP